MNMEKFRELDTFDVQCTSDQMNSTLPGHTNQ